MKSTRFISLLVISGLLVLTSAEDDEWDDINARPNGRRNFQALGTYFGKIISDVGALGAHLVGGVAGSVLGGGGKLLIG